MTAAVTIVAVLALMAAVVFFLRSGSAEAQRRQSLERAADLDKRLVATQEDLNRARDDLKKRSGQLEEARDRANKAKKKESRDPRALDARPNTPDPVVLARFEQAVTSAEKRAVAAEKELAMRVEQARDTLRQELQKEIEDLKRRLQKAERKDEPRVEAAPIEAVPEAKPHVPGAKIDLAKLEPAVVDELRRFYKRAVNNEKLLALAEGRAELAQDKLEEMRRRFFAVCRELSLAALNSQKAPEVSDQDAARLAMDMVTASEEATQRRMSIKGDGPSRRRPAGRDHVERAPREAGAATAGEGEAGRRGRKRMFHREGRRPEGTATGTPQPGTDAAPAQTQAPSDPAPTAPSSPVTTPA